ncbi:MAG: beta-propeller fold lactonase family protein, partial [Clostridia bacterium]|nr:beta-propeller fold lactonase family protein [Clostridia bacterium]
LPDTVVTHEGHGVNPARQEAPHTHFTAVAPDGYILCCDLGLDTVFTYDEDLNEISRVKVPDGHGCRHLEFSNDGKTVWCVNEMGNTVSIFDYCDGVLTLRKTVDALPDFDGQNTAAAIRKANGFLYVSHRGADSVARFEILPDGDLRLLENTPVGGVSPRDIWIVDDLLLCANEITDSVTVLKMTDGKPTTYDTALSMKHPLCICEK